MLQPKVKDFHEGVVRGVAEDQGVAEDHPGEGGLLEDV